MYIAFEGLCERNVADQIAILEHTLNEAGYRVATINGPQASAIGDQVMEILEFSKKAQAHQSTQALMLAAAKAQLVEEVVRPLLRQGYIVLLNRREWTMKFFLGLSQITSDELVFLSDLAEGKITPELVFLIDELETPCDLPRHEFERARELYLSVASLCGNWTRLQNGENKSKLPDEVRVKVFEALG